MRDPASNTTQPTTTTTTTTIGRRSSITRPSAPTRRSRQRVLRPPTGAPVSARPAPTAPAAPAPAESGSIIEQHRSSPPVTITHETSITGATAEALWESYRQNFEPLETLAVLQHLYTRDEMLEEFANPRILKIVGWQGGEPVGLAMVTNSLDDVPQISPAFLRSKYPEHAAREAIYFGILVMVSPGVRGLTLFSRLSHELWQVPASVGGVLIYDICDFNRETFGAETLMERIADSFPRSSVGVLDRQTWYAAELPEPIADGPNR